MVGCLRTCAKIKKFWFISGVLYFLVFFVSNGETAQLGSLNRGSSFYLVDASDSSKSSSLSASSTPQVSVTMY